MDFGSDLLLTATAVLKIRPSGVVNGRPQMVSAAADGNDRVDAAGWKTLPNCWM